jgi:hypothetical protein
MRSPRGFADADKREEALGFPGIEVDNSYDFHCVLMLGWSDLY